MEPHRRGVNEPAFWEDLACFFPLREGTDGPPFPVSVAEIERVFGPLFRVRQAEPPARSAPPRHGLEWLVRAERLP